MEWNLLLLLPWALLLAIYLYSTVRTAIQLGIYGGFIKELDFDSPWNIVVRYVQCRERERTSILYVHLRTAIVLAYWLLHHYYQKWQQQQLVRLLNSFRLITLRAWQLYSLVACLHGVLWNELGPLRKYAWFHLKQKFNEHHRTYAYTHSRLGLMSPCGCTLFLPNSMNVVYQSIWKTKRSLNIIKSFNCTIIMSLLCLYTYTMQFRYGLAC